MDSDKIYEDFCKRVRYLNISTLITIIGLFLLIGGTVYGYVSGEIVIQLLGIALLWEGL